MLSPEINKGDIVVIDCHIAAYNDTGTTYRLEPGSSALVIDEDQYDLTLYTYGEVLYCPASYICKFEKR